MNDNPSSEPDTWQFACAVGYANLLAAMMGEPDGWRMAAFSFASAELLKWLNDLAADQ